MEIIKAEKVIFEYVDEVQNILALNGVDMQIKTGEFVAILGHNGSGKSTLAKHMNALLLPTEGTVWVKGTDTKTVADLWSIRKTSGMVFQNPDNQIVASIVEEDVAFGPENLGVKQKEIRQRVDESLKAVHMEEYAEHSPHFLSGGQKQRVAIAGVLAMKPDCIILDEPTAMLDPMGRKEVLETVMELNRNEGITIVLITHFMEEAILADRVIVVEEGKIILDDIPNKVFSQVELMESVGLGVPAVTQLSYNLSKAGLPIDNFAMTVGEMVEILCQSK